MLFLPLTPRAGLPLLPGLWEARFQSYCLKAGSYAMGENNGYADTTLKGKQAEIVAGVLRNSALHPEIDRREIQLLLWTIVARSKPSECSKEIQKTARVLLNPKERDAFQAEARLREMLVGPVLAPYHEVEKVAVLTGDILPPPDSRQISWGRWNYDPDGYFIRYFPYGYRTDRTQIYYPESFTIEADENGLIISSATARE